MLRPLGLVDRYRSLAKALGHALFLLVALNLLLSAVVGDDEFRGVRRLKSIATDEALHAVYPVMSLREVDALLRETESRPKAFEAYTGFKERPFAGKYVNVAEAGFRVSKGQGPWPPDPSKFNVFVFGGSTVFGYGVADDQTVPSYLGERLSAVRLPREPRVYNFGRDGYYSVQERILFEKLLTEGAVPDMALFIDGSSDAERDEPFFSERLAETFDAYRRHWTFFLRGWLQELPMWRAVASLSRPTSSALGRRTDPKVEIEPARATKRINRYLANRALIEQAARHYGMAVAFVWQPVPGYKYDAAYHLLRGPGLELPRCRAFYERMAEFVREQELGHDFLWCSDMQEGLKEPLYVDAVHYTGRMSERFATLIVRLLLERGLLPAVAS